MNRFCCFFLLLGLGGCISNIDRVAPMSWTYYLGNDASEIEIRMALLECGSNVPGDFREFHNPEGKGFLTRAQNLNDIFLIEKCMQNAGFSYSDEGRETCVRWKDLPACKPDAFIPKRSVENRLNSLYCKIYPKTKICQPEYSPSAGQADMQASPKSVLIVPSSNPATKLQEQVQKDSNTQMRQLQQGVETRK